MIICNCEIYNGNPNPIGLSFKYDYKELFLQYIKNEKNFSKNTLIAYRNDLSQFHDYLNRKLANFVYKDIDYPVLREWVMMLMSMDMSNRTVCRKIGTIRKFFKFFYI